MNVVALSDHMVTPGPALEFAELLGQGSVSLENDCGHILFECDGERVQRTIREFFER